MRNAFLTVAMLFGLCATASAADAVTPKNSLEFEGTKAHVRKFERTLATDAQFAEFATAQDLKIEETTKADHEGTLPVLTLTASDGTVLYRAEGREALRGDMRPSAVITGGILDKTKGCMLKRHRDKTVVRGKGEVEHIKVLKREHGLPTIPAMIGALVTGLLSIVHRFRNA